MRKDSWARVRKVIFMGMRWQGPFARVIVVGIFIMKKQVYVT